MMRLPRRFILEVVERMIADAGMINLALVAALLLRFFFLSLRRVASRGPRPLSTPPSGMNPSAPIATLHGY
jgi:hypothetical protein